MCGLLLSMLTLSAVQAEITWNDVTAGISQSASVFKDRVALPASTLWPTLRSNESHRTESLEITPTSEFAPEVRIEAEPDGRHILHILN